MLYVTLMFYCYGLKKCYTFSCVILFYDYNKTVFVFKILRFLFYINNSFRTFLALKIFLSFNFGTIWHILTWVFWQIIYAIVVVHMQLLPCCSFEPLLGLRGSAFCDECEGISVGNLCRECSPYHSEFSVLSI